MRLVTKLIAVALAIAMVGAGVWIISLGEDSSLPADDGNDDVGNTPEEVDEEDETDTIVPVSHPETIGPDEAKFSISLDFPGQGVEGAEYQWDESYGFVLDTTGDRGWKGRAVVKVFAEKSGEIGPKCLVAIHEESNTSLTWKLNEVHGSNHVSGDAFVWKANGTDSRTDHLWITFNRTGSFNLTFQVFDAATGKALSVPVETGPIEVPVVGGLEFKALGKGEWRTIDNATYYVLLLNVTNGWNIRYEVYSEYLFLSDGIDDITVSKEQTSFDRQSLAPGQNTQFLAFFPIEEGDGALELTYSEPGKAPVSIPLSGT